MISYWNALILSMILLVSCGKQVIFLSDGTPEYGEEVNDLIVERNGNVYNMNFGLAYTQEDLITYTFRISRKGCPLKDGESLDLYSGASREDESIVIVEESYLLIDPDKGLAIYISSPSYKYAYKSENKNQKIKSAWNRPPDKCHLDLRNSGRVAIGIIKDNSIHFKSSKRTLSDKAYKQKSKPLKNLTSNADELYFVFDKHVINSAKSNDPLELTQITNIDVNSEGVLDFLTISDIFSEPLIIVPDNRPWSYGFSHKVTPNSSSYVYYAIEKMSFSARHMYFTKRFGEASLNDSCLSWATIEMTPKPQTSIYPNRLLYGGCEIIEAFKRQSGLGE